MLVLYRVGAPLHATLGRCPVAVAGTRNPTPKGRELARELGRILAETGYTVVTGLARGVDEEATLGALEIGGRVVAVLPYLFETDGKFNPRAAWLLRVATSRNATVSVVSENPVKDDNRVRTWFAMRNRIITRLATALVVPETKFKLARWGTRHAVEHALAMRRLVVVFEPRVRDGDVVKAYEQFRRIATAVRDVAEAVDTVRRQCRHGAAR
jgi:DNA processing protein